MFQFPCWLRSYIRPADQWAGWNCRCKLSVWCLHWLASQRGSLHSPRWTITAPARNTLRVIICNILIYLYNNKLFVILLGWIINFHKLCFIRELYQNCTVHSINQQIVHVLVCTIKITIIDTSPFLLVKTWGLYYFYLTLSHYDLVVLLPSTELEDYFMFTCLGMCKLFHIKSQYYFLFLNL